MQELLRLFSFVSFCYIVHATVSKLPWNLHYSILIGGRNIFIFMIMVLPCRIIRSSVSVKIAQLSSLLREYSGRVG